MPKNCPSGQMITASGTCRVVWRLGADDQSSAVETSDDDATLEEMATLTDGDTTAAIVATVDV